MQEHVGLLIAAARRRIKQAVIARTAIHHITPQQFWFLIAVLENPRTSQAELASRIRSDAPTVSRVLASLARRKLVRVTADASDRRRSLVSLTPSGERLARELVRIAEEVREAIVHGMTSPEVAVLRRGLDRVIENLDRFEGAYAGSSAAETVE